MDKKILYIDMDGVLVDLEKEFDKFFTNHPHLKDRYKDNPDHIPGIFRNAPPLENAIEAVNKLYDSDKYDMYIATAAPWGNPMSSMDKRFWIEDHFGSMFHKKMFVTHRKDLLIGHYLIDDRTKNGAGDFMGEHLHFGWNWEDKKWNKFHSWDTILDYLL
jgi:5'(3')-deoxyribonucleotidase